MNSILSDLPHIDITKLSFLSQEMSVVVIWVLTVMYPTVGIASDSNIDCVTAKNQQWNKYEEQTCFGNIAHFTEHHGVVVSIPAAYSGTLRFPSQTRDWLS
jgi:hypothetical protein